MNLFVYSDESGVFDRVHNDIFVFGGLIFLDKNSKNIASRKYIHAEHVLRSSECINDAEELKACRISNKAKSKLFRSLNQHIKFGVVIHQKKLMNRIFQSKKDKQRYLDYAYKICLKRALEHLIAAKVINPLIVENMYVFVDEHTTATNGIYELREGLEQEFKTGTYNMSYDKFFPPLFRKLKSLDLKYCNSATTPLIRAADIVANKLYYLATKEVDLSTAKALITHLPK